MYCAGACVLGRARELKNILRWLGPRVFEDPTFVRDVHQIRVGRVRLLGRRGHGNVVLLRIRDQIHATFEVPLAPRSNDFDVRLKRVIRQLETHLIVAFAGRAVRDSVSAFFARDLDLVFCDHRTGERSAHQIHAFVNRIRFDGGPDVVAHKLFAQIFDVEFRERRSRAPSLRGQQAPRPGPRQRSSTRPRSYIAPSASAT